ncbi:hypothetical protein NPIL_63041 [Nephila pilipes]|uniref:Uncharacterized protein n=1 Tax=Nephila pilipes TaxID=299642 RepID=A0A8X6U511_NEPPI|nr:hypothetical protein NPIL_63041 [Nephila pilipes]
MDDMQKVDRLFRPDCYSDLRISVDSGASVDCVPVKLYRGLRSSNFVLPVVLEYVYIAQIRFSWDRLSQGSPPDSPMEVLKTVTPLDFVFSEVSVPCVDSRKILLAQKADEESYRHSSLKSKTGLNLQLLHIDDERSLYYDVSDNKIRPYVPREFRTKAYDTIHSLSHHEKEGSFNLL